jgi:hypothetical protein
MRHSRLGNFLKFLSRTLEGLAATIILESGVVRQNSTGDTRWDRIKGFTDAYLRADSVKSQIETYRQELRDAMLKLSVSVREREWPLLTEINRASSELLRPLRYSVLNSCSRPLLHGQFPGKRSSQNAPLRYRLTTSREIKSGN